jgi:HEAT repeat protein
LIEASTFELRDACIDGLIYAGVDPKRGPDPRVTKKLIHQANFQNEPTTQVRLKAIMALGAMGRPQSPADYQEVMSVLKSKNNYSSSHPTVRIWSHVAVIALDEKADKKDLDTIAEYLKERTSEVKFQAVTALGALEDKAQAYVPNLCDMVLKPHGEDDPQVLAAIATSLGRMSNKGERVKDALVKMTEHDDPKFVSVVMSACMALAQLGISDGDAIKKALDHRSFTEFQKVALKQAIEEARKPKKPVKIAKPERGVGPGVVNPQQNRR